MRSFDYVIVGGGTAGCVLASRLSECGKTTVLLLEAGGEKRNPWLHVPVGYFKTIFDPGLSWQYATQPEPELDLRSVVWPRGRVLGGTGAINGMVYVRGQKQDFDHWRELGNNGWGFDDVFPYFLKSERQAQGNRPVMRSHHGDSGPLTVSDYPDRHVLCEAFINAAEQSGLDRNTDFNGDKQDGAGYYQITTRRGLRADTAAAFLGPVRKRPNLHVQTRAHAMRIRFQGRRAIGVEYLQDNQIVTVSANVEIIICAGAVNSPQLLQLSGIGDADHLRRLGISVVVHRADVGRNLQDHLQAQLVYRCQRKVTINDDLLSLTRKLNMVWRYLHRREGPIAGGPAPAGAFARSGGDGARADLQFHFLPLSLARPGVLDTFSGFSLNVNQSRPHSRGEVAITSSDPAVAPRIQARYLSDPRDREVLVAGLRIGRAIVHARGFDAYRGEELRPGKDAQTDEALLAYVRRSAASIYHPVGTCRMGSDDEAVVDPLLRVRGLDGIRIADASIMPTLVSGNTNAATIMIAEKAADLIRASSQPRQSPD